MLSTYMFIDIFEHRVLYVFFHKLNFYFSNQIMNFRQIKILMTSKFAVLNLVTPINTVLDQESL